MAWSTPGVLDLHGHGPVVVGDGPVDLADRRRCQRHRVPLGEGDVGRGAELALDDARRQLGRHGRRVLLQVRQGGAGVVGQPDVEVRRHLAQLHEGALHAAERLGHLLGGAQLERLVELGLALGRGEHPSGLVDGEAGAGPAAHPGQLGPALAAGAGHHRGTGGHGAGRGVAVAVGEGAGAGPRLEGGHRGAGHGPGGQHLRSPARHVPNPTQG